MTEGTTAQADSDVHGTDSSHRETVAPIVELFTHAVSALWITTYGLDLALFNEFLFPRLGDPPLNVTVLADHRRLTGSLDRVPPDRAGTLDRVNRRWLLRGVQLGAGAFHPKTYLAVTGRRATLLVGSGNLSRGGLDEGNEVFTSFGSGTAAGDAAIGTWLSWMARVVRATGDTAVLERFNDLRGSLSKLNIGISGLSGAGSPLIHNLAVPLAEQLTTAVRADHHGAVDELILTAPFYDPDAHAVARLLTELRPRLVRVFVNPKTSVRGDQLVARLTASRARIQVICYPADKFIHAKLVGVIAEGRGWLLSGSPNLSQAALLQTALADSASGGNVEVAVLAPLPVPAVRAAFYPPHLSTSNGGLAALTPLGFRADPEPDLPGVRLLAAKARSDGMVEVTSSPPPRPDWRLMDLSVSQPVRALERPGTASLNDQVGTGVTTGPLTGRLVVLVNEVDAPLSNRVVVDDPNALAAALAPTTERLAADHPAELNDSDLDSPLGRALIRLDRAFILDVDDIVGGSGRWQPEASETDQDGEEFWDRLEREQIARDSRVAAYWRTGDDHDLGSDPLIELLEALRHRSPGDPPPRSFLTAGADDHPTDEDSNEAPKRRWKQATRIRVRARNLLRRWADAQNDPRLAFVHPLAPGRNFAAIVSFLCEVRQERATAPEHVELSEDDLDDIWLRWLLSIAGTGRRDGWLGRLGEAERAQAVQSLPDSLASLVAALCWLAIRPDRADGYRSRVIAIQPVLRGVDYHGIAEPTDAAAEYLGSITGQAISSVRITADLQRAACFVDDKLWCQRTCATLALDRLELENIGDQRRAQFRLRVAGVSEPLLDPRLPRLIVEFLDYRRFDRVQIFADEGWRLVVDEGQPVAYLPGLDQDDVESTLDLTDDLLRSLTGSDAVLADLFNAWPGPAQPEATPSLTSSN